MQRNYHDEIRVCIRKKIIAQKENIAKGETSFTELLHSLNNYAWECFAELEEKEIDPRIASVFAKQTLASQEIVRKLLTCSLDYAEYLAEKQKIDETFRRFEMGDNYERYQEKIKAKIEEEKLRRAEEEPPPFLIDPPGDYKKRLLDFMNAVKIRKGTCQGVKTGPPTPIPIWPKPLKIYPASTYTSPPNKLECVWEPVKLIKGCGVTYSVQIQPQVPAPTGNQWYFAHKGAPYIAFGITKTNYILEPFEGFFGRWRVWAVYGNGRRSEKSSWQYFFFPILGYKLEPEELSFTFHPNPTGPGKEVYIVLSRPKQVTVYFNGKALPKKTSPCGKVLTITVPADATDGYFELQYNEHRVQTSEKLIISEGGHIL